MEPSEIVRDGLRLVDAVWWAVPGWLTAGAAIWSALSLHRLSKRAE